jgi:hypothetical protein
MHAALERAATGAAAAGLEYRCDLPHEAQNTEGRYARCYHILLLPLLVQEANQMTGYASAMMSSHAAKTAECCRGSP